MGQVHLLFQAIHSNALAGGKPATGCAGVERTMSNGAYPQQNFALVIGSNFEGELRVAETHQRYQFA